MDLAVSHVLGCVVTLSWCVQALSRTILQFVGIPMPSLLVLLTYLVRSSLKGNACIFQWQTSADVVLVGKPTKTSRLPDKPLRISVALGGVGVKTVAISPI